jgi:hypothetical protein
MNLKYIVACMHVAIFHRANERKTRLFLLKIFSWADIFVLTDENSQKPTHFLGANRSFVAAKENSKGWEHFF